MLMFSTVMEINTLMEPNDFEVKQWNEYQGNHELKSRNYRMVWIGRDLEAHPAPPAAMGMDTLH